MKAKQQDSGRYMSDIVFIGNGDMVRRKPQLNTPTYHNPLHIQKPNRRLGYLAVWEARGVIGKTFEKHGTPWNAEETQRLMRMKDAGVTRKMMCKTLGRTWSSIHNKLYRERRKEYRNNRTKI